MKKFCQCETCLKLKSKFTPEECRALRDYAKAIMRGIRQARRKRDKQNARAVQAA